MHPQAVRQASSVKHLESSTTHQAPGSKNRSSKITNGLLLNPKTNHRFNHLGDDNTTLKADRDVCERGRSHRQRHQGPVPIKRFLEPIQAATGMLQTLAKQICILFRKAKSSTSPRARAPEYAPDHESDSRAPATGSRTQEPVRFHEICLSGSPPNL